MAILAHLQLHGKFEHSDYYYDMTGSNGGFLIYF